MHPRNLRLFLSLVLAGTMAAACSIQQRSQTGPSRTELATITQPDTLVIFKAPPSNLVLPPYRLSFGDEIEIKLFNHPEFNEHAVIRPDGRIALEKAGEIVALGMTPQELDSVLTARLSRIIRRPDVTVMVRSFGKRHVYILGEVRQPGAYEIKDGMTVLRAIAEAGGLTGYAKLNSVVLMRNEYYRDPIAVRLDLSNFTAKPDRYRDRLLATNDIVYVPRTFIGHLNDFVDKFFTKMVQPPLDSYLRYIYFTRAFSQ